MCPTSSPVTSALLFSSSCGRYVASYFCTATTSDSLIQGYKIFYRTSLIPPAEVDLISGKREIDEEEEQYLAAQEAKGPQTWKQKLWDAL